MTSYYLVQDDKGLFYIRRRILWIWGRFLCNSSIQPYWWSEEYTHNAYFKTETDALSCWERAKAYSEDSRKFTVLRKLS